MLLNHSRKEAESNQPLELLLYRVPGGPLSVQVLHIWWDLYNTNNVNNFHEALPQNMTDVPALEVVRICSRYFVPRLAITFFFPGSSTRLVSSKLKI